MPVNSGFTHWTTIHCLCGLSHARHLSTSQLFGTKCNRPILSFSCPEPGISCYLWSLGSLSRVFAGCQDPGSTYAWLHPKAVSGKGTLLPGDLHRPLISRSVFVHDSFPSLEGNCAYQEMPGPWGPNCGDGGRGCLWFCSPPHLQLQQPQHFLSIIESKGGCIFQQLTNQDPVQSLC